MPHSKTNFYWGFLGILHEGRNVLVCGWVLGVAKLDSAKHLNRCFRLGPHKSHRNLWDKHMLELFVRDWWDCSTRSVCAGVSFSCQPHRWKLYIKLGKVCEQSAVLRCEQTGEQPFCRDLAARSVELVTASVRNRAEICQLVFFSPRQTPLERTNRLDWHLPPGWRRLCFAELLQSPSPALLYFWCQ